jgi:hypothetical protein
VAPSSTYDEVGSVALSLTRAGGYRWNEVGYDVSGNSFHQAGAINVGTSTTISTIIGAIPFGSGYLLKLTAQDVDHKLTPCVGTTSFDIATTATVPVPVHLTRREIPATQSVPVPPWASVLLGGVLAAAGSLTVPRRARPL